jgi:hypothetical protein
MTDVELTSHIVEQVIALTARKLQKDRSLSSQMLGLACIYPASKWWTITGDKHSFSPSTELTFLWRVPGCHITLRHVFLPAANESVKMFGSSALYTQLHLMPPALRNKLHMAAVRQTQIALKNEDHSLESSMMFAHHVLTNVARRQLLADMNWSLFVTVLQWDIEKEEVVDIRPSYGQVVIFGLEESGEKSFYVQRNASARAALRFEPGHTFLVKVEVRLAYPLNDVGGFEFTSVPTDNHAQSVIRVADTFNERGRTYWDVTLHAETEPPAANGGAIAEKSSQKKSKSNPKPSMFIDRVTIRHNPDEHVELMRQMGRHAIELERILLGGILHSQLLSNSRKAQRAQFNPVDELSIGHDAVRNSTNLHGDEDSDSNEAVGEAREAHEDADVLQQKKRTRGMSSSMKE